MTVSDPDRFSRTIRRGQAEQEIGLVCDYFRGKINRSCGAIVRR